MPAPGTDRGSAEREPREGGNSVPGGNELSPLAMGGGGCIQKLVTKPRLPDYPVSTYVDRPRFTSIDPRYEKPLHPICNNFLYTPDGGA